MPSPDLADDELLEDGDSRLKALRALLRHSTPHAAAEALGVVGGDTWADIEQPARPRRLKWCEAKAIADAAGMPRTFFTAPLSRLGDMGA